MMEEMVGGWNVSDSATRDMGSDSNGMFQGDNPLYFSFPLLLIQMVIVIVITRSLSFLLKPLKQPRVVGEILGGILLGPTALGRNQWYLSTFFPKESMPVLQNFAQLGLLLFLFIVGLELDVKALRRTGVQSISLAAGGIVLPFGLAAVVSFVAHKVIHSTAPALPFAVFMGVAMADTAFPVLARILGERKLLKTEVGQLAMSAAAINDVVAWVLLALAIGLSGTNTSPVVAAYTLMCTFGFVLFSFLVTGPVMKLMVRASPKEGLKEIFICITFAILFLSGLATDVIGIHPVFGAFIFGLVIPKEGPSAGLLTEKLEDLVSIVLLPLYFASSGLKTSLGAIQGAASIGLLVLIIVTACAGKILGTMCVAKLQKIDTKKSFLLGVLMNTKGLTELIILNIGRDIGILNDEIFAILVIMALTMTITTTPLLIFLYKPVKDVSTYKRRSLEAGARTQDLSILFCVHGAGTRNIPSMFNLAETVRGVGKHDALQLFMLHLYELSPRGSSLLPVKSFNVTATEEGRTGGSLRNPRKGNPGGAENLGIVAFKPLGKLSKVTIKSLEAVSEFESMHEDVFTTALEKQAAIVILPYHKHQNMDGGLETTHPDHRTVTCKLLDNAPCSVGILIDRAFGGVTILPSRAVDIKAAVLFFGGPDDREALAFSLRMAEHPGVKLDIVRFIPDSSDQSLMDNLRLPVLTMLRRTYSGQPQKLTPSISDAGKARSRLNTGSSRHHVEPTKEVATNAEAEQQLDNAVFAALIGDPSMNLKEVAIRDLTKGILSICSNTQYNIILAGRNLQNPSPLVVALINPVSEFTEEGPVADILKEDEVRASVLIMQKFDYSTVDSKAAFKNSSKEKSSDHKAKETV